MSSISCKTNDHAELHSLLFLSRYHMNSEQQIRFFSVQLLQKEAGKRFGSGPKGSDEIKSHKWFRSINWKKLEAREIQPSFCPEVAGKHCVANFEERWTAMPLLDSPAASPKGCENPFRGYSFMRPDLHSCK